MSGFVHPALLAGLALVGVPVLIHLINMLRHRRVSWAAMEFLLASQRRNRTWVLLKQLLLLLLRMAAIATIVFIVARPLLNTQLGRWLGGVRTHHIVLLDDSYSMSDRWADTSAFDEAKAVIQQLSVEAARQVLPQQLTLLRFSRAARSAKGAQPDIVQEQIDTEFPLRLREQLACVRPSQTAAGPAEVLDAALAWVGGEAAERRIVYLVSDFRARQWAEPAALRRQLLKLNEAEAAVVLVQCVETAHPNLAITALAAVEGTKAAGVPMFVEVAVHNHGLAPARDVAVLLEEDGQPRPATRIERIAPGTTVRERFLASFATAGEHVLAARLDGDAVAADNFRYHALALPATVPVLLVDGDPEGRDARFVAAALAPGGSVRTGISTRVEAPRFLSLQSLDAFQAIYVLNVDRLERSAIAALEAFVRAGGGVGFFVGERSQAGFINQELYRGGEGLFPLPLAGPSQLLVDRLQPAPDLDVSDHPIFRVFGGERNSFIGTVSVEQYFAAAKDWQPPRDSPVRVIARLRNGVPLAVEHRLGEGRVVAFLTTAAPVWNNWAKNNPSFVVAMQELQAWLATRPAAGRARVVGEPLQLEVNPAQYRPQVRFVPPAQGAAAAPAVQATAAGGVPTVEFAETYTAGVYEAQLVRSDGSAEAQRFAYNVDPDEGDLRVVSGEQLAARLEGVRYAYETAHAFRYSGRDLAGADLGETLLYLLVVLLLAEQILAWSASYHPAARRGLARAGGVR